MTDVIVWHNPRCSKSREAVALLREHGAEVSERRYLDDPPTRAELDELLGRFGVQDPRLLMRTGEKVYRELGLDQAHGDALLDAIVAHPILLERPVIVRGERAVTGRPPQRALTVLE